MPYIGQSPATGEANSFKTLDDITSYTLTFDGSSASTVSVANDTITERNHRFVTGQRVTYNDGGGTSITGLSDGVYYIIVEDKHTFKLATNANNAAAGTAVNLTGLGVGSSHTLNVAFDGVNTKFKATVNNGTRADITSAPQVMLSINGVLQQPHNNTTSPTTGYAVDHTSTIIFSAAPATSDQFFASLVASSAPTFDISDNVVDNFTGDGSATDFTLSKAPPNNESVLVTIDGVVQYPDDTGAVRAYTVSENILTFASAPGNGVEIQVRHIGFAGASTGGISGFYGRTGNAVLKSTDNIVFNNATASGTVQAANVTVTGDLTVNGTTTTLDTELTSVDKLEVDANNTTVAAAVTQRGNGDILNLYDGGTEVFSVLDGGAVRIGGNAVLGAAAGVVLQDGTGVIATRSSGSSPVFRGYTQGDNSANFTVKADGKLLLGTETEGISGAHNLTIGESGHGGITIRTGTTSAGAIYFADSTSGDAQFDGFIQYNQQTRYLRFGTAQTEQVRITSGGLVGIGTDIPESNSRLHTFTTQTTARTITETSAASGYAGYRLTNGTGYWEMQVDGSNQGLRFLDDGTEKLRIDSAGRLLLGTTTEGETTADNFTVADAGHCGITIRSGTSSEGNIFFSDGTSGDAEYRGMVRYEHSNDAMVFKTATVERFRIASNGNTTFTAENFPYCISTSANKKLVIEEFTSYNANGGLEIRKKFPNGNVLSANYWLGDIHFKGWDGDQFIRGAKIEAVVEGTPANNVMPCGLRFSTNPGDASTPERLRITKDGKVGINDTSPDATLSVGGSTALIDVGVAGGNRGKIGYSSNNLYFGTSSSSGEFIFKNNVTSTDNPASSGTERLRIDSSGNVRIMTANGQLKWLASSGNDPFIRSIGSGQQSLEFNTGGSERLRISSTGQIGMGKAGGVTANGNSPLTIQESDSNSETICLRATNSGGNGSQPGIVMKTAAGGHIGGIYCDVNSDYMRLSTSGTDRIYIANDGKIGINDSSPAALFTVNNGTTDSQCVVIKNDNVGVYFGTYGTGHGSYPREVTINGTRIDSGTSPYLRVAGQGGIKFCSDLNNERMRIRPDGKVEIHSNQGNYGNNPKALNIGSRTNASFQGSLALARGETIGGGTGPLMEFIHGPDGGTQRVHQMYSYVGDLRIYADAAENLELSGENIKIKDASRDDIAIFNSNGIEMEKNTARLFGRYVGRTNTSSNYELTSWTAGSFRILEVFGFINPNAAGSGSYYDPAHFYVYNATGWNGSSISYYLGIKHVAPGARTYAPSGTGNDPTQTIVAKWGNNNSTATTNGSHYLKFEWSGANTSNNYGAWFRVIRRM